MPYTSLSYDTPSFPSGHVVLSKVYSEILGNTYPQIYNELQRIHEDICDSRIALGLHYQSDVDVAIFVGEKMRKPGAPGAPTADAFKKAAKTAMKAKK